VSDSGKSCRRVSQGVFDSVYMTRAGVESKIEADRQPQQICVRAQVFWSRPAALSYSTWAADVSLLNIIAECPRFLRATAASRQFIFINLNRSRLDPGTRPPGEGGPPRPCETGRIGNQGTGADVHSPPNSACGACCIARALPV
jgi:hypothetical protein